MDTARRATIEVVPRRALEWATAGAVLFAALVAATGAAFGYRPSLIGALLVAVALAVAALLVGKLTRLALKRLGAAAAEALALRAALSVARSCNEALQSLANHDPLTGLPNRGLLYDRLGLAIAQSHRQSSHLALLFLDLDDFKLVNDSTGHGVGDRVLVDLAGRLRGFVRAGDTVARFGGDEFVVLLDPVAGAVDAARLADEIREVVGLPTRLDGREISVTASVGVSMYPADGASADALVKSADAAMYQDKRRRSGLRPLRSQQRRASSPFGRASAATQGR